MKRISSELLDSKQNSPISDERRKHISLSTSVFGLVTNAFLFLLKLFLGIFLGLYSIFSDSINNLSDFGNNILSIFGVKMSSKPADKEHPYGHYRIEYIIALILASIIMIFGAMMLYQGGQNLYAFIKSMIDNGKPMEKEMPFTLFVVSLTLLCSSVLIKMIQSLVYKTYGNLISSMPLCALSKDSLNDCVSTSLLIVSLVITWLTGYDIDCFFNILVAVLVIISGVGIMKEASNKLIGEKPSKELIVSLVNLIKKHKDVLGMHDLALYDYGRTMFGVIHIEVDAKENVFASHELCDAIEKEVLQELGIVLTVHMDPILIDDEETNKYLELVVSIAKNINQDISIHDFRIVSGTNNVNLIFDAILPSDIDDARNRALFEEKIKNEAETKYHKNIHLVVCYDLFISDLLFGTEAEKINH